LSEQPRAPGVVGTSVPRVDGAAKVRGTALYVDDLAAPDALHGATVRSQIAHGVLRAIRRDPSFDWTDVVIATAEDIPGQNAVYLLELDQPALVPIGGTIRHVDEPVALVAAPTRRRAQEAAEHVILDVDPLPAVYSIDDALRADVKLYGDDNVFKRFEIRKGGDVEAALASADLVIEGEYETGAQEQMYIEPQGMIARWRDGTCEVTGSLQCPYYVHKALVPLLGLPGEKVIVAQSVTGGGFGGKEEYPSIIAAHAAVLSRKAGRAVKIVYDRDEDIGATTKRHPARVRHRLGLLRDGSVVAIDVDVVFDGGAYVTLSPVVLSRGVLHAAGPYRCPTVRVVGRAVATNTPPHGAFRGFGAPQTTFAYERQMEKAARLLGIDPFDLRRRTMLRLGDATATSQVLTYSVGSDKVLEAVAAAAGPPPSRESGGGAAPPIRRGRGLAFYFHGAGFTGSGEQRLAGRATLALAPGGRFVVRTSSTDIGQGALTMFSQIAATALGVDVGRIDIAPQDTSQVPDSGPTVASRTCMVVGGVVGRAALGLRKRIEAWAEGRGIAGGLVEAAAAMATEHGTAVGEVSETVQYEPPPGIEWDDATYTGSAYPVYGWACCLVDVAVDLDTFEVVVERCIHAIDVGKAIHPILVKGQIEGGTLQALGWALWESVVYREGRVMNRRMTDCIVPTFADAPEMETILVEEPYPFGPHGAKGVGEIPMDGPAAAVANAIEDALGAGAAAACDRLPILPESIQRALAASARGQR
jgi:CO/xanthine dehydrogenase Mo-binding subunit